MTDKFTPEQRVAIKAQGKTIVSASAGSGKTTVMIEKIVRLVQDGQSLDSLLAVTFTKKAASQMKEKLSKELIKAINAPETTAEHRAELKRQLVEVPNADISTIHSFCAKLLRRNFFAVGIDNSFRVIAGDDADGTALKNEALDELFDEAYEHKDVDFQHLLSVYWRKKSDNTLRKIFTQTYGGLRDRADYRAYLEKTVLGYDENTFNGVCADLKERLDEKSRYYAELLKIEQTYFESVEAVAQTALANELLSLLSAWETAPDYFDACAVAVPKFTMNRGQKSDTAEKKAHMERLAFLKKRLQKIHTDELQKINSREEELRAFLLSGKTASVLAKYLLLFDEKYAQLKTERGVLDYNDLEHKTLELLKDENVLSALREKYKYVFVDEYQDVNPVQEAILSQIGGENVFLVGDVKQAIYGFRGSKSKFFLDKQKEFALGTGNNLALTRNFRSADAVLNAVNMQFSLAMSPRVSQINYARDSLMERGGRYQANSGRVQVHFFGKSEKKEAEKRGIYSVKAHSQGKKADDSELAKLVYEIIKGERRQKYYDPDTGRERQVQYSDIVILSRKNQGRITKTIEALSSAGIPVSATSALNICECAEIKTLIDILSLIDNAEQDVPLCSALLSSMGDLTANDLAEIRLAYPDETYFRGACKRYANEQDGYTARKLRAFYLYYDELRTLSRVMDAGELLCKLLSDTHMESRLLTRENGVACLKRIHRFIEETAVPESLCVHAFLDRLRDLEYNIPFSENGGENAVKVMTMHASKGLEFPIVILDDLSAPFHGVDHDEVFVEEKYGLAPRAFYPETMLKNNTLLRRLYEEQELENSIADALNLYYVALTRAKFGLHMLFESRSPMPDVKYARSFAEFTDFGVWEEYVEKQDVFDIPKQGRKILAYHPDEVLAREIIDALCWKYPFAGYEDLPVKSSATHLLPEVAPNKDLFGNIGQEKDDAVGKPSVQTEKLATELATERGLKNEETRGKAVAYGLAYHAFLEDFDFSSLFDEQGKAVSKERLRCITKDAYERCVVTRSAEAELLSMEKLEEILSNSVFYKLRDKRLYKEQQFLVSLPVKDTYAKKQGVAPDLQYKTDGEEMLFQGAIDLLAVGEDGVWIIDYKYSGGNAEYLREHYRPQLELYRLAVSRILKTDVENIRCTIVNIRLGFEVDVF